MKKTFKDLSDENFDVEFTEHDITKYKALFHVTLLENVDSIHEKGLLRGQPQYKSLVETNMLFFSYPIDQHTGDCFRWNDDIHALVVVDVQKLINAGIKFYDDYFGSADQSSKRNHLCCDADIPADFIKAILKYDKSQEQMVTAIKPIPEQTI